MKYKYNENYEKIDHHKVQMYIDKMNNGDKNSRIKVINHYANQVKRIIDEKYSDTKYNKDDLFEAGFIGLLEALKRNSTKYCTQLSHSIYYYIEKEIKKYINSKGKKEINTKPKDIKNPIECVEEKETVDEMLKIINNLPQDDKNIIYLYFYQNKSINQIGEIYNLTKQTIHNRIQENIISIRVQLYLNTINIKDYEIALNNFKKFLNKKRDKDIIEVLEKEKIFYLDIIINELPNKKRNILYFYLYGNYSIKDIANIYKLNENYIQSIIYKSIIFIKQYIKCKMSKHYYTEKLKKDKTLNLYPKQK